ncbi:MAG: c-type cytochrome [Thermoleophilia bacterium]|nr:c-type cytochrome [Thermoleophilia bacterium]
MAIGLFVLLGFVLSYQFGFDRGRHDVTSKAPANGSTQKTTKPIPAGPGKQLFTSTCGGCHTLAAAATKGTTGPNLDVLKPDNARVLAAIKNGGAGSGMMPKGLFKGTQATQVAEFVSTAAGR